MNVLDLFSGIGGFALGLEQAGGFQTVAFCEQDEACRKVLNHHWPDVPVFRDVCTLTKEQLNVPIHVITGGFPCQDLSLAGKGAGLAGERSGLWFEFQRLIQEFAPAWVIIENVPALRNRGLEVVLGGLSALGYDAEWHCLPAAAVGAPHRRDRLWIIAYPRRQSAQVSTEGGQPAEQVFGGTCPPWGTLQRSWPTEPGVCRVVHGFPGRMDRINRCGNAVVPRLVRLIGEAINASTRRNTAN